MIASDTVVEDASRTSGADSVVDWAKESIRLGSERLLEAAFGDIIAANLCLNIEAFI